MIESIMNYIKYNLFYIYFYLKYYTLFIYFTLFRYYLKKKKNLRDKWNIGRKLDLYKIHKSWRFSFFFFHLLPICIWNMFHYKGHSPQPPPHKKKWTKFSCFFCMHASLGQNTLHKLYIYYIYIYCKMLKYP